MADLADLAQEVTDALRDEALAALRLSRAPAAHLCQDCTSPIPAARRAAMRGAKRCLACQEAAENHG